MLVMLVCGLDSWMMDTCVIFLHNNPSVIFDFLKLGIYTANINEELEVKSNAQGPNAGFVATPLCPIGHGACKGTT